MGGCRSFAARSVATLGTDLVHVEVLGSDHRSRRQRPEIEEEYKKGLINLYSLRGPPIRPEAAVMIRSDPTTRSGRPMRMKVHHWGQAESFYRFRGLTKPSSNSGPSNCFTFATRTPSLCKPFGAHAGRALRADRGQDALAFSSCSRRAAPPGREPMETRSPSGR